MRLVLGGLFSVAGPLIVGWLIVSRLWPESPRVLRISFGVVTGLGAVGAAYFAALSLVDSAAISLMASETLLAVAAVVLLVWKKDKLPVRTGSSDLGSAHSGSRILPAIFLATIAVSIAGLFFILDYSRQGGWDAIAIWNLKARFIVRSDAAPLNRIVDPSIVDTHPDYPLLLPALVARGWQYAGRDSSASSAALAALFTISTFAIAVAGIQLLCGKAQAYLTGCVLAGTPFFLLQGVAQYGDIVLCCFITATVILLCLLDEGACSKDAAALAGLLAGFAACTKNEGILFLAIVGSSRLLLALWKRDSQGFGEIARFGAGALPGVAAVVLFKVLQSPPSEFAGGVSLIVQRIQLGANHVLIWKYFLKEIHDFGQWWIYPIPLLLLHVIVARVGSTRPPAIALWPTPALVLVGMLVGEYSAYLVTPYDLAWHLGSSLSRLIFQIWPTALVLYSVASTPAVALNKMPQPQFR